MWSLPCDLGTRLEKCLVSFPDHVVPSTHSGNKTRKRLALHVVPGNWGYTRLHSTHSLTLEHKTGGVALTSDLFDRLWINMLAASLSAVPHHSSESGTDRNDEREGF